MQSHNSRPRLTVAYFILSLVTIVTLARGQQALRIVWEHQIRERDPAVSICGPNALSADGGEVYGLLVRRRRGLKSVPNVIVSLRASDGALLWRYETLGDRPRGNAIATDERLLYIGAWGEGTVAMTRRPPEGLQYPHIRWKVMRRGRDPALIGVADCRLPSGYAKELLVGWDDYGLFARGRATGMPSWQLTRLRYLN